ncbi:hypothetical protein ACI2JC_21160 [Pseudomonas fulva]|uniref:hypothetical protein n=1 Tax=Pseudomonas fulva TaxID=47880 RepID=UPI003850D2ED
MDTNKMREQFEAAFIEEQVSRFGAGYRDSAIHMLKRDGEFEGTPTAYELRRREQGMYDTYWIEMLWWAWQASREAVVVDLPKFEDYPASMERDMQQALRIAIEAQGLKVTP